jgi:hypothetical protein
LKRISKRRDVHVGAVGAIKCLPLVLMSFFGSSGNSVVIREREKAWRLGRYDK